MENKKKTLTSEELMKQYKEAKEKSDILYEQFQKAKQDEEDRRKAQLALEKEERKKAVEDAYDNYVSLLNKYVEDYGSFSITRDHKSAFDPWKWWL